jgi:hypothetical protein
MRQCQPQQLNLPGSLQETTDLREQTLWQRTRIEALHADVAALEADRDAHRELHRQTHASLSAAYTEIALLKQNLRVAHALVFKKDAALPDWLSSELRRLLALAHPDRWSAGQDAGTLAHEITVALVALRQRLGEV